ncbi:MAG: polysaccharide deacetylase family protein [Bacteroidales bacterium]|nr:polysaccharide deacetylase family protein [Bacteroidales bacterium]
MIRTERIAAKIVRDLTWHFTGRDNELFLTFDDGPTPEITPWVLSVLKDFNARATFFCIGKNVKKHPELYNQIINEGHSVGNHCYSHIKGWRTRNKKYIRSVEKAAQFIDSDLFRPPFGRIRPAQINRLKKKFNIVMWDVLSRDYNNKIDKEKCLQYVIDFSESGSIIVFHDTKKAEKKLKYTLPKVLKHFSEKGFSFNLIENSKSSSFD